MLILRGLVNLVQHRHHAVHERLPEVDGVQGIPAMLRLRQACQIHFTHVKHFQSGGLELKVALNRIVVENLFELFET